MTAPGQHVLAAAAASMWGAHALAAVHSSPPHLQISGTRHPAPLSCLPMQVMPIMRGCVEYKKISHNDLP